jgi:hypothetical protein
MSRRRARGPDPLNLLIEKRMRPIDWRTTCPTLAIVHKTSFETLNTWCQHLPSPQTDVQRTIRQHLHERRKEMAFRMLREKASDLADQFDRLMPKMRQVGIAAE